LKTHQLKKNLSGELIVDLKSKKPKYESQNFDKQNLVLNNNSSLQDIFPNFPTSIDAEIPNDQRYFMETVLNFTKPYKRASNELKKSSIRRQRMNAIKKILPRNLIINGWIGKISILKTTGDGNAYLAIKLLGSQKIKVGTMNNEFSEEINKIAGNVSTLISSNSELFIQLSEYSK
jgi:hypothetical protein